MFTNKESKKGIIRSLIAASIFLIFLKPILELLWDALVKVSSISFSIILDRMYFNAALGQRNWIDFMLIASIVLIGGILILTSKGFIRKRYMKLDLEQKLKTESNLETIKLLKEKLDQIEESPKAYNKFLLYSLKNNLLIDIPFGICCLYIVFSTYTDLQLNTSFNQRLAAISPYISDTDIKSLKSKWAIMRSRKDFELINSEIEKIASEYKLNLPKNLLP